MPLVFAVLVKKGPLTKPDKLRGGQHGGPTDSETEINHIG